MEEFWLGLISQMVVGVAIAILTAFVTVRLSLRQFRSERWWERKAEAYGNIFEALHHIAHYYSEMQGEMMGYREMPEERRKELGERARKADAELDRAIDVSSFVLSVVAVGELQKLQRDLEKARHTTNWSEHVNDSLVAVLSCLERLRVIGRNDLDVKLGALLD